MASAIRIGIVGAGDNTRVRHIPGLRQQKGVEIVSVCNRSQQSSEKVAKDFGIPTVHNDWLELHPVNAPVHRREHLESSVSSRGALPHLQIQ